MLAIRQTAILIWKNFLLVLVRHPITTPFRAFLLPVIFSVFLAYARNLFIPPSHYGIATASPVRSLEDALGAASGDRDTVAFVNNGLRGGDIDKVIAQVATSVTATGKQVQLLTEEVDLLSTCRTSLQGVSQCFGAAVFHGSPTEGPGGMWNYSLRADGGLGFKIDVNKIDNDAELYVLPLQHAVDFAIARQNTTIDQSALPSTVYQYPYTSQTEKQRQTAIRTRYAGGVIKALAIAFFIGMVGVVYQFVGIMASERELGMSQMIEASMPNRRRWEPQMIRFAAYHIFFDLLFLPSWIVIGLILGVGVFQKTSVAIVIIFHILTGLSLSSFSLFVGAFFKKAQLSGIVATISALLLGVIAQVIAPNVGNGAVIVLSLLFPPMNYVNFTIFLARWERQNLPANLVKAAPQNPWTIPGIVLWVLMILQIIIFPILAAWIERSLYGTASKGRVQLDEKDRSDGVAVHLSNFTKTYRPSWWARTVSTKFGKKKDTVIAVDSLNLSIPQGQISILLGSNGSGKSTTLDTIAGLNTVTSGTVAVDGRGGLGICPQKNVLWDLLTALEHVKIFSRLKSTDTQATRQDFEELLRDCDLSKKMHARSKQLSGGQKRKLQLSMMFSGGSKVCCIDECSSGVDALARQKLWQILLRERGRRTMILTTHFLDEADLLSDQIAILSKGVLTAQGSAVELKHRLGGYRINVFKSPGEELNLPAFEGIDRKETLDRVIFTVSQSSTVAECIRRLDDHGIRNYEVSSPTIEEIFFSIAENAKELNGPQIGTGRPGTSDVAGSGEKAGGAAVQSFDSASSKDAPLQLQTGRRISIPRQALVLFRKRFTVTQRNYLPYAAAFLIPIIATGIVTILLKGYERQGCSLQSRFTASDISTLLSKINYNIVVGPVSKLSPDALARIEATLPGGNSTGSGGTGLSNLASSVTPIDGGLSDFNAYVSSHYANVTPGGLFLGSGNDPPTFAYQGNNDLFAAAVTQNAFDTLITNVSISTQYQAFDEPYVASTGNVLQLVVYFGLAMCAAPAFFALYPTFERLRSVRQLHYSNGVRSSTLWSAYLSYDFVNILVSSAIAVIIFRIASDAWYHIGYLFVVLFLYGTASALLGYVISLFSRSQLAAFAFTAGYQSSLFLIYFIAFLSVLTYVPAVRFDSVIQTVHFTIALITPSGNLIRALFVALNIFSTDCENQRALSSNPAGIKLYGGPIVYLIGQSIFLFCVLLWWDSSSIWARLRHKTHKQDDNEQTMPLAADVAAEIERVSKSENDGLRVQHITKAYGRNVAVQDVTFGVQKGEIYSILGVNGAGKTTLISLVRGDIKPDGGDILVEGVSAVKNRANARSHLGVCPQVDACDQMTVLEHLTFYARVRGVADVKANVAEIIRAVGLDAFQNRMAAKLSGGNKRKLSLAIALMGNPSVLLLDEPSSGMDVLAKRLMWRTLNSIAPGRSLVLTTHSMEEADALADRAGIIDKRMLAIGTSDSLRKRFGNKYHVHLIMRDAPHTPDSQMINTREWILRNLPGADVEEKTWHGQLRFSVPAESNTHGSTSPFPIDSNEKSEGHTASPSSSAHDVPPPAKATNTGIAPLFTLLEAHKKELGFEYYSVSQTTLDQVFLTIVAQHNIEEENAGTAAVNKRKWWKLGRR